MCHRAAHLLIIFKGCLPYNRYVLFYLYVYWILALVLFQVELLTLLFIFFHDILSKFMLIILHGAVSVYDAYFVYI